MVPLALLEVTDFGGGFDGLLCRRERRRRNADTVVLISSAIHI